MPDESSIPLEETVLTIEIDNKHPIELIDLTTSLLSLGEEYKRFVTSHPEYGDPPDVRLYIKEIRSGSVKADLIAIGTITAQSIIPALRTTNTVIALGKHLKAAYDYFTGKTEEKPELQKAEYTHLKNILEVTAKDNGSQVNFITNVNKTVYQSFSLGSGDANEAQNTIGKELIKLQEPEKKPLRKKVLTWYQARNDSQSHAGDRGIIESVSSNAVKIDFDDEQIKESMLHGVENPFLFGYIVDVMVETINGRPALYKVIKYHGPVEKPEQGTLDEIVTP